MPNWLSSTLIVIGFLALVIVAILPRNVEVNVTTIVKDNVTHNTVNHNAPSQPVADDEYVAVNEPPDEQL